MDYNTKFNFFFIMDGNNPIIIRTEDLHNYGGRVVQTAFGQIRYILKNGKTYKDYGLDEIMNAVYGIDKWTVKLKKDRENFRGLLNSIFDDGEAHDISYSDLVNIIKIMYTI